MTRTALVTGASAGLGLALTDALLQRDFRVIATSREPSRIPLHHPNLHKVALDLDDPDSFPAEAERWQVLAGPVSLLFNNAGYGQMGPAIELDWKVLQQQLHTNTVAPLALAQALLPQLIETGGTIVNIGSVSAHLTTPFAGGYCASKSALHSLNDAIRRELAPFGVKVQCVMAGGIRSDFGKTAREQLDRTFSEQSRYRKILSHIQERAELSQKNGSPAEEVADQIVNAAIQRPQQPYIKVASGARQLYNLSRLPHRVLDRILSKRFGLTKL
ncbi:short-subunit dehydrogenase [Litorivivens lipolytica]|uniref:Short-subunit dehydrogenase n=1 Tax=Litorivivens lipolytica TaxID=1524264 RepID=A0A7W4W3Q5_9GAMM|nr:SDR family NAD(P)-dependent oxidoreductase [Litorivivens lipolytica]MBB3046885.1 short-subunit dehydrogenase [Litorivivens lipolytica]